MGSKTPITHGLSSILCVNSFPHFGFPYLCGVRIAQDDRPASPMRDRLAHLYRGLPTWTLVGWRLI